MSRLGDHQPQRAERTPSSSQDDTPPAYIQKLQASVQQIKDAVIPRGGANGRTWASLVAADAGSSPALRIAPTQPDARARNPVIVRPQEEQAIDFRKISLPEVRKSVPEVAAVCLLKSGDLGLEIPNEN
jgi:hypothetical protein